VLMHGFPDNLLIYDALAPALAAAGRRAIAFDFVRYGASDKPVSHKYTLEGVEATWRQYYSGYGCPPLSWWHTTRRGRPRSIGRWNTRST
jgi:pimeloyl-ACP methyl ester carboxylesterase